MNLSRSDSSSSVIPTRRESELPASSPLPTTSVISAEERALLGYAVLLGDRLPITTGTRLVLGVNVAELLTFILDDPTVARYSCAGAIGEMTIAELAEAGPAHAVIEMLTERPGSERADRIVWTAPGEAARSGLVLVPSAPRARKSASGKRTTESWEIHLRRALGDQR